MTDTHRIEIQVDSTSAGRATVELRLLTGSVNNAERSIAGLNGAAMAAKAALVGLAGVSFGFAIKEIASFETKMLQLKALTMANETQMKSMEKQARELGATTSFSAQQAAEAMGTLASAGLKTNEIMKATPQIMKLAAAGSMELAKAADQATGTMHALGLGVQDLGRIGDVFTKVAGDTSTSVELVGESMKTGAVSAKTFGVSLEQLAAVVGIAANNQIKGAEAGNNFKSMLSALGNETKDNMEILKKHGLTYKDLNIEVLGITKVLENLNNAHLSGKEAMKIYGSDAMNLGSILAANSDQFKIMTQDMEKANGSMQAQTDILNQGLAKAWDSLLGALGEAAQQFGEVGTKIDDTGKSTGGLKTELTNLIQAATGVISIYEGMGDKFAESNKLTKEQYQNLKDIAGELKQIGGAAGGIAAVTGAIWAANGAMIAFNAAARANPFVMGASMLGAGVGLGLANRNTEQQKNIDLMKKSNSVEEASLKLAQQREKMASFKEKAKDWISNGRTGAENAAVLKILEQRRDEQIYYANNPIKSDIPVVIKPPIPPIPPKPPIGGDDDDKKTGYKKGLSDAQKEVNKQQEEYNRLVEKFKGEDPFEKYNKEMSELYRVQKSLNPETFLTNQKRIADEFMRSTVDLNAYNQELAKHKKLLDNASDYNSTIDELTRNKKRGAITQGEYGLGVATANAGLMNQVSDKQIPVKNAGEVIDAQNTLESEKALTKLNEEATKTIDSFNQIGNSGKMAFDGILGGISAVASAASNFSDVMTKLNDSHNEYAKNYQTFIEDTTKSEEDKAKAKISYEKENAKYQSASFAAEISGARQLAGAASKMFGEKSAARKAFHAVEITLSVIEMAMSVKKIAMNAIEAVTNQGKGDPYSAFPRIAAMAALMAAITGGIYAATGGGGSKAVDNTMVATSNTGTVLGDKNTESNSVKNIVDTLNDIDQRQFPQLKELNDSFKSLESSMSGFVTTIARQTDSFTNMIGGLEMPSGGKAGSPLPFDIVGNFLFGTKTTVTKLGEGFIFEFGNLFTEGAADAITGKTFLKYQTTKKSLFGSKTTVSEIYGAIDDEIMSDMQKLFGYVGESLLVSFETMNVTGLLKDNISLFNLGTQKWDFSKADDKEKYFNSMINATADRMANVSRVIFGEFQKLGEGMFETVGRLAIQMTVVQSAYKKLGFDLGEGSVGLAGFSDRLVQVYNSTADAKDGLKNFIETMNDIYNLTHNEGQKSQKAITDTKAALTSPLFKEMTGQEFDASRILDKKYTLEMYTLLNEALSKLATASAAAETEVNKLSPAVEMANTPEKQTISLSEATVGSKFTAAEWKIATEGKTKFSELSPIWQSHIKTYADIGSDNFKAVYDLLVSRDEIQTAGIAAGGGAKTPAEQAADLKVAEANSVAAAKRSKAVQGMVYDLEVLSGKTIETFTSLQDEYLKTTMSADDWKKVERDRIIDEKFIDIKENMRDYSNLSAITSAMIKEDFEGVAKSGVITAASMQRYIWTLEDAAKATKKLADAAKYLTDFSSNISGWVNNQKVTQIGSTKSQLDAAGKSFDALMLRINLPTNAADKKLAMSGITQSADAYMNSIKNFYGSSKVGQDLMQSVIDKVGVLPESVDIQQLILDKLEEIRSGVIEIPKFGGVLSPESTTVIDKLAADIKAAVDKNLTAPTLQNAQALNANAQVMLTLQNISAMTNSTDGVFLDKLIKSVGSNTGLNATVNATIYSSLDQNTKQSVVDTLTNSFAAIQVSISKFKANPTPEGLASLQNDISRFDTLVANVNGKVTALNLDPNNASLKAGVQGSLDQMNAFSAKISGLTLSPEAIKAANASIEKSLEPVPISVTAKPLTADSKSNLAAVNDLINAGKSGVEIKVTVPKINADALASLNDDVVASIGIMDRLKLSVNNVATALGDKNVAAVVASTSSGKTPFDATNLVAQPKLGDVLSLTNATSYFDSALSSGSMETFGKIGAKMTAKDASTAASSLMKIFGTANSSFNTALSFVEGYNNTHLDRAIQMDASPYVLNEKAALSGEKITDFATKDAKGVALSPAIIESNRKAASNKDYDTAMAKYNSAIGLLNSYKNTYAKLLGFNEANSANAMFADGGAFTNGIVSRPTSFNMGLMGEAGSEAIMPLQNIGGSLGVRAVMPAANDSGNSDEELAELKAQNKILLQQNAILREGFGQLIEQSEKQNQSLRSIKTTTKEAAYA